MNSTAQPDLDPQAPLPTGLTLVASRSTPPPRTSAEVESNRAFLAAAGRVEFGRYEATLRDIWMAFAYFASLSDARECYGTGEHIAEKARRSGRTVRRTRTGAHRPGPDSIRQSEGRTRPLNMEGCAPC